MAEIIRQGREKNRWSQAELAQRAGVSSSTIARAEQNRGSPNPNTLRRIAITIGYDMETAAVLARDPKGAGAWLAALSKQPIAPVFPRMMTADQLMQTPPPLSPQLLAPPPMSRVPHFGGVSAVQTDLRDESPQGASVTPGLEIDFTVSVDGQCMEPRYQDGERVGCSIRRWESEGFVWERDYWIRFKNGETTLKRVRPDPRNKSKFICAPLNPRAKSFSRFKSDVEKAARVLTVLVN